MTRLQAVLFGSSIGSAPHTVWMLVPRREVGPVSTWFSISPTLSLTKHFLQGLQARNSQLSLWHQDAQPLAAYNQFLYINLYRLVKHQRTSFDCLFIATFPLLMEVERNIPEVYDMEINCLLTFCFSSSFSGVRVGKLRAVTVYNTVRELATVARRVLRTTSGTETTAGVEED